MKIALTHNRRTSDDEAEAEFDSQETVEAIAAGIAAGGHEVEPVEVSCPVPDLLAKLASLQPDLIFNMAEGRAGKMREAFFPLLYETVPYAYTGSDAHTLALTLDKWLCKTVLSRHGIDTPRSVLFTQESLSRRGVVDGSLGVPLPVIVKPNFEGSSKGICDAMVSDDWAHVRELVDQQLATYPEGVLVDEFIAGIDLGVPFVAGLGDGGILCPTEYEIDASAGSRFNLYDYRLKNVDWTPLSLRCPARLSPDAMAWLQKTSKEVISILGVRDLGRIDFRLGKDGRIFFIEMNAIPSLERGAAIFLGSELEGLSYEETILHVVKSAAQRSQPRV